MSTNDRASESNGLDRLADSVERAAVRLGIGRSSVYTEIRAGRLRAVKMRGKTLITRADQQAWLDSLTAMAPAAAS